MRACPHCSHEIQEEAVKCRHCKREVQPPMWLSSMRRCPYCAEWIELDRTKCPQCDSVIGAGGAERPRPDRPRPERTGPERTGPGRTAPFVESSLDDLVGGLRREAESGPELRDDLGVLGRGLGTERPARQRPAEPEGRGWQADLAAQLSGESGSWEAEFAGEPAADQETLEDERAVERLLGSGWEAEEESAPHRSWEAEASEPVSRRVWQPDEDRPESRRGWVPQDDRAGRGRGRVTEPEEQRGSRTGEPVVEPEAELTGQHSWEAGREPEAPPAEPKPKERRFGPFRLGRKEPKAEQIPGGPEPLFAPATEVGTPVRAVRADEDERSSYAALPPGRRRETSSFPPIDREALLSEEGGSDGRGRRLAAALGRTLIALFVVGALGVGGFLLVRGPGAPLLAQLLATDVPVTPTDSPEPTATLSRAPTLPPESPGPDSTAEAAVATQVAGPEGCVLWDQVTVQDEGEQMCVYGEIRRWFAVDEVPFVAIFSEEVGTFALVDRTGVHPVGPGDCVMGSGVVEVMRGTRPNIDVQGDLMPCPSG